MNVIAIFDVGKTNKKIFLFDEYYKIVWEQTHTFAETTDEDGAPCEDLEQLTAWVESVMTTLSRLPDYTIRAINFSAYGASFVHIGEGGAPVAPLYNYLKPYPPELRRKFYDRYGGEVTFSMLTASPVLGNLNSGMQLYRIKDQQPDLFAQIKFSLHLPQYLSYLLTGKECSDITSIGCHTNLWNFSQQHYHEWVYREGIIDKLAPLLPSGCVLPLKASLLSSAASTPGRSAASQLTADQSTIGQSTAGQSPFPESPLPPGQPGPPHSGLSHPGSPASGPRLHASFPNLPTAFPAIQPPSRIPADCVAGVGLHDSSAAMIPYLESFQEPFVLISTGTWCISMNPFNQAPLTVAELQKDCLCYITYQGRPVKASRLFAGYEHEQQVKRLAAHFHKTAQHASSIAFDPDIVLSLYSQEQQPAGSSSDALVSASVFAQRDLENFSTFEQAYHRLIMDIMEQQIASTQLVLQGTDVKRIFVDGGFGRNQVYMHLLAAAFPHTEVFAASIPQATAMGAALAIHSHWNTRSLPGDIIELKYYK